MSFVLPIAFFVIFASIFAGASGEELRLKLAVADEVRSETSQAARGSRGRRPGHRARGSRPGRAWV